MKKIFISLAICLQILVTSCSSDEAKTGADLLFQKNIDGVPVLLGADGDAPYVAMLDADGDLKGKFDCVPDFSVNGIFKVPQYGYSTNSWGDRYRDINKLTYMLYSLSDCEPIGDAVFKNVGYYVDGCIPVVTEDKEFAVVDNKGKVRFLMDKTTGKEVKGCMTFYSYKRLGVTIGDKLGFIDTDGKLVIPAKYDKVTWFINGYALVCIVKDENVTAMVIDTDGNQVSKFTDVDDTAFFNGKYVAFKNDNKYLIFDMDGEKKAVIDNSQVEGIVDIADNAIIFRGSYKYGATGTGSGVMNFDGKIVIAVENSALFRLSSSEFLAVNPSGMLNGESIGIIDDEGEEEERENVSFNSFEYYPQIGILAGDKIEKQSYGQINKSIPVQLFDIGKAHVYDTNGKKKNDTSFRFIKGYELTYHLSK